MEEARIILGIIMKVSILIILVSIYLIQSTYAQNQVTLDGDNGVKIIVNTSANFGAQIYRDLEQAKPTPTVTSSSDSAQTTTSSSSLVQTTAHVRSRTANVELAVISLKELDNSSNSIAESGHAVNKEELLARGYTRMPSYQAALNTDISLQATCTQFIANPVQDVAPKGTVNLTVCVTRSNGTISGTNVDSDSLMTETIQVYAGQVWMSVAVTNWTWCTTCQTNGQQNVSGQYLNVEMEVKVNKGRKISNAAATQDKPARFSLGADASLDMSKLVVLDGRRSLMPSGFPKLAPITGDWKGTISVSLPRFTTSGSFWQVIEPGHQPAPKDGSEVVGGAVRMAIVSNLLVGCTLILALSRAFVFVGI